MVSHRTVAAVMRAMAIKQSEQLKGPTMLTKQFWLDLAERALKTAAQFVLVTVGGNLTDAWSVDWKVVAGTAAAGAFTSVLTSLVSLPIGSGTASVTNAVEPATPGKHVAPE